MGVRMGVASSGGESSIRLLSSAGSECALCCVMLGDWLGLGGGEAEECSSGGVRQLYRDICGE